MFSSDKTKISFGAKDPYTNLKKFYRDVVKINREFSAIEYHHTQMTAAHQVCKTKTSEKAKGDAKAKAEGSRTEQKAANEPRKKKVKIVPNASSVQALRSMMDYDCGKTMKRAKRLKDRLPGLLKSNELSLSDPGCGPGSLNDRTRSSAVRSLKKDLDDTIKGFQKLQRRINEGYKDTVKNRYCVVTGENPDQQTVDLLISTGDTETFFQKANQMQGTEQMLLDTIAEIQEWGAYVRDIEKNFKDVHQIFLDTAAVFVQHRGKQSDDIEAQVHGASSSRVVIK